LPPERWRGSRPAGHCSPREDPARPESSPHRQICIWPRNPALRPCGPSRMRPLLPEKWSGRRPAGPFAPREDRMRHDITNAAQNGRAGTDARPGPVGRLRGFGGSLGGGRGKGGRGGGALTPCRAPGLARACSAFWISGWFPGYPARASRAFPRRRGPGRRVCVSSILSPSSFSPGAPSFPAHTHGSRSPDGFRAWARPLTEGCNVRLYIPGGPYRLQGQECRGSEKKGLRADA
jgi:hypothetical protein